MTSKEKQWKKNLYENQGFPDNYTHSSFLKDLQKNVNVRKFTYLEAVEGASRVNQQLSCLIGFLTVFYLMYKEKLTPEDILLYSSPVTMIGYLIYMGSHLNFASFKEDSKTVLSVLIFGYLFSPLLHNLTDSISTDTIYSTTFFVMFIHLLVFDYGVPAFIVSKAISLNASIFGSICLASRLSSAFHAFVLLVVSTEFFALFPILLGKYRSPFWLLLLVPPLGYALFTISLSFLITYLILICFINIICPLIFVNLQKHKNNIHGPWDEAIIVNVVELET